MEAAIANKEKKRKSHNAIESTKPPPNDTPFVTKLKYFIDDNDKFRGVLGWSADGKSFAILKRDIFQSHLLPQHFGGVKFSSFMKRLFRYGFRTTRIHTLDRQDAALFHPYFQRDKPELLHLVCPIVARSMQSNKRPASSAFANGSGLPKGEDIEGLAVLKRRKRNLSSRPPAFAPCLSFKYKNQSTDGAKEDRHNAEQRETMLIGKNNEDTPSQISSNYSRSIFTDESRTDDDERDAWKQNAGWEEKKTSHATTDTGDSSVEGELAGSLLEKTRLNDAKAMSLLLLRLIEDLRRQKRQHEALVVGAPVSRQQPITQDVIRAINDAIFSTGGQQLHLHPFLSDQHPHSGQPPRLPLLLHGLGAETSATFFQQHLLLQSALLSNKLQFAPGTRGTEGSRCPLFSNQFSNP